MSIPIQNIYYLLCYAWNKLEEQERISVSVEDQTELVDLFGKVLINASRILLKRGIDQYYVPQTEVLSGIKGRIDVGYSLKRNLFSRQQARCVYEDFSPDILTNRILVSTLIKLLRTKNLDVGLKNQIRRLVFLFPGVEPIEITSRIFKDIRLNRNNRLYDFLLKVCLLIHENLLPAEEPGVYRFSDFRRDEHKMNRLFEAFLYRFYQIELQSRFTVKREQIRWDFISADDISTAHLPLMHTDITLENEQEKIIIDAKYYRQTLAKNYESEKVRSENLYQLFSYLINQRSKSEKHLRTRGILLYPTVDRELNLEYQYERHHIQIKTIDLNRGWRDIFRRLVEVVETGKR